MAHYYCFVLSGCGFDSCHRLQLLWVKLLTDLETIRFWKKIKVTESCWLWTGALSDGYGLFKVSGKTRYAHRLSYGLWNEMDENLLVLHKCDIKNCVYPLHLFQGTQRDNIHDMISKGRAVFPPHS